MALSADRNIETVNPTRIDAILAGVADTIYKGSIVKIETDGYCEVADGAAASVNFGIAKNQVVCAGSHAEYVEIERGRFWLPHTGAAQTDVGTLAWAVDDQDIAHAAQNATDTPLGLVIGFKTGYLEVDTDRVTL
jgi:hypothetical protein